MGRNERRRRQTRKELLIIVLVCLVIAGASGGYILWASQEPTVSVAFVSPEGKQVGAYDLEIAADGPSRAKGLMFRKKESLPSDRGMLFLFPQDKVHTFWMKETYIPLDMIFVDSAWQVVGVVADVPPLNESPRGVSKVSRHVIELNAGEAAKLGLQPGWKVKVRGALPQIR